MTESAPTLRGWVDAGFEGVASTFQTNFEACAGQGAAFCAVHRGRVVVDLAAGLRADQSPWTTNTLATIFSGSKGLLALCLAMLAGRGLLSVSRPVAHYWPEFAANGKATLTVSEVLTHRARMPALRAQLSAPELLDGDRMATLLAAQAVEQAPGAALTYHPFTMGWICAELIRRVDGRGVDQFLADEVAAALGVAIYFGLPATEHTRTATLQPGPDWLDVPDTPCADPADEELRRAVARPPMFADIDLWNRPAVRASVIPAAGGIASATGMARLYGHLVADPARLGGELVNAEVLRDFIRTRVSGCDGLSGAPLAFGLGFQVQNSARQFGPAAQAFGHAGAGGSRHGAWPELATGFSYLTNTLSSADPDPRSRTLLDALHECLQRRS